MSRSSFFLRASLLVGTLLATVPQSFGQIAYVQSRSAVPQTAQSTVTAAFSSAQTGGNLNVVVVGWNDSVATVQSVTDTKGNTYTRAVGPTVVSGFASQAIYYAKNIAAATANSNTVTVTFNIAAQYVDLRIAEYSGLDQTNPVDVVAANSGNSNATSSGAVTTTNANDLLVGANLVATRTTGAGTSFTSRIITNPDADILEDRIVTATGSYSATAPVAPAGLWIMQMVAFRAAGSGPPPPADLTVTKSHTGNFVFGQVGAQYSIVVRNSGGTSTSGQVSLVDTLPNGLTATAIAGTNWNCTLATLTCTRTDALAANATYPTVTVTVTVNTASNVTNVATVSGGGETNTSNDTANDATTVVTPDLIVAKTHVGSFSTGQVGAQYTLTVSNTGQGATTAPVTVTDTLPAGLTATAIAGTGWTCTLSPLSCNRIDALNAGASYPNVTVTVNVAANAQASVTNTATVSGGNETNTANDVANDVTSITSPDTQAPTVPGTLTSTAISGVQINLSWGAATDNVAVTGYRVERCQGSGCSNFAEIAALGNVTTFSDTGLTPATSYSYIVRAQDAVVNLGPYSNVTTASTLATDPHLLAAYGFNEGTGTVLGDATGNGNPGTIANGTWTAAGKFGGALTFNGTSTLVTIADKAALHLSTGMTLEAWVKPSAISSAWRDVVYKGNDNYYLAATTTSNSVPAIGQIIAPSSYSEVYGPSALTVNTWAHLAATYDNVTLRLYVNGVQVGSRAQTGAMLSSTNPLQIGGDSIYGQFFSGVIDEVRVYDIALTATAIQTDMNTPIGSVTLTPDLTITKSHAGAFSAGQVGAQYTLTVTNVGPGATTAQVTVADTLPSDLTATDISGIGWTCTPAQLSCNRNDSLGPGASYPSVVVTVTVSNTAPSSVTNTATVAGGGETNTANNTANDPTSITAPDTQPPSVPGTLTSTTISGAQIDVAWGAATDNVGVVGYRLERCQGAGCSNFSKLGTTITGTSFSDTGLTPSTSYSYIVRAQDAAGNLGPYSNVTTSTTLATNPHLLAAYGFNEGAGTALGDTSGNGNTGTIANGTWTTSGKFGGAVTFNGNNTLVTIPDNNALHLTTGMTLEAWVMPSVISSAWRDVVYKGNDNFYLVATTTAGTVPAIGQIIAPSTYSEVYAPTPLALNTWTHLAATYDNATLRLYVNGVEVGNRAQAGAMLSSTNPLQIGGDSIYGQFFSGIIDEVRIYDVALTPSAIQSDMNTPIGTTSLPLVTLSTSSIDFGLQPVGTPTTPIPVTVTNTGGSSLSITSVAVSGPQSAEFSQTNTCGNPIPVNGTCSISVRFTPSTGGTRTATISITDNAPGTPHTIALSGTGDGFFISPTLTVLTPGHQQQFTASGPGSASVTWLVDSVVGGTAATGTITTGGLYTAPAVVGTHTVTGRNSQSITSSATAYIVNNPGVFTQHIDNTRAGANTSEVILTPSNVNSGSFGKLFSFTTDGISHASPLYVAGVNIPGVGIRNVVYVSTEHDSVYAFDADGLSPSPLWHKSFINPPSVTTVPNMDTGECCDITPEIGITGTPVIDPTTGTLYVVAKTKENNNYFQRLHALDITTGAEKFGGPVLVQATVTGGGVGSTGNQLSLDQLHENQRTGLMLLNGIVYFGFGSHGDIEPYHGWVLGYNATTLQRVMAFSATPNGEGGGIWHSGGGLVSDAAGNIYAITGDGTFNANSGGVDYGDSFLKLNSAGAVVDYFTPHDQGTIDTNNLDLGAGGMVLLPDQPGAHPHMLVSGGKNGSVYLVDRDTMGHYNASNNTNVQTLNNIFPFGNPLPGNYSSPVFFNGNLYFGPIADNVQMFRLNNGLLPTSATSRTTTSFAYPGASLVVSANGTSSAILWATEKKGSSPGTLHAYDANNLQIELYNSDQAGTRDSLDSVAKFSVPLVVNGKVYVVTEGRLTVFGLLP